MSAGYVYVLGNAGMHGIFKVGRTTNNPKARAAQLYTTGVPYPFDVVHSVYSPNCVEAEYAAHQILDSFRIGQDREFFDCDLDVAIRAVDNAVYEQLTAIVQNSGLDLELAGPGERVDRSIPATLGTHLGMSGEEVLDVLEYVTPDDLKPAIERRRAHMSGEKQMDWVLPVILRVVGD